MIILCLPVTVLYYNTPFPSYLKPLFQSEAKCKAIEGKYNLFSKEKFWS